MTKIKKVLAILILCLIILLVGYSWYTSSRLTSYPRDLDSYNNATFYTNDGGMVVFMDGYAWYTTDEHGIDLLKVQAYEQGMIVMTKEAEEYMFTAIDDNMLYDAQRKVFLERRKRNG